MDNIQLRCPHCTGPLTYEDRVCPYCGQINEQAARHVKEKDFYSADYQETKETAKYRLKWNAMIIVASVLLIAFLIGIVWNIWYSRVMYSFIEADRKRASVAQSGDISETLDALLEEGDYLRFNAYLRYNDVSYGDAPYTGYRALNEVTMEYWFVFRELTGLILNEERNHAFIAMDDRAMGYITMGLTGFYQDAEPTQYTEGFKKEYCRDPQELARHAANMEEDLKASMMTYFAMSEEEFASLRDLPEEEMTIFLWELWERRIAQ